jgi:hypothetical protein
MRRLNVGEVLEVTRAERVHEPMAKIATAVISNDAWGQNHYAILTTYKEQGWAAAAGLTIRGMPPRW